MARDLELALRIRADVAAARSEIRRVGEEVRRLSGAGPAAGRGLDQVGQSAQRAERSAGNLSRTAAQLRNVLAGVGAALSARALIQASDTYQLLGGRLKLVTRSAEEQRAVEQRLFEAAQRTRSAYTETVELYARVARNAENLGASQAELLRVTEAVNQAIQVSGATTAEAAGGVIQFSQALASGELRGEELRSVMEAMPRLAQAIVDGLEEIGVGANLTLGDLRKLAEQGELTSERIFQALLTQTGALAREFAALPRTVGGAMTQLGNDVQRALAQADMQPLIDGIDGVRQTLTDPATLGAIEFFGTRFAQSINLTLIPLREAGRLLAALRRERDVAAPLDEVLAGGDPERLQNRIAGLRKRIDAAVAPDAPRGSQLPQAQLDAMRQEILQLERARQAAVRGRPASPDLDVKPPEPPSAAPAASTAGDDAAAKAAQDRANAIAQIIDSLREQAATEGMTAEQVALYRLAQQGADAATIARAQALIGTIQLTRDEAAAMEASREAAERQAEAIHQARMADQALLEELAGELHLITLSERARAQETAERRLSAEATDEQRAAVRALAGALYDQQEAAREAGEKMSEFAVQAAHNIQSAFADFLFDPFQDGLDGMLLGFVQTLRRIASEALAQKIGERLFGELLKTGTSAAAGGGGGDMGLIGGLLAGLFHSGGIAGQATAHRELPALAFRSAPRFHGGGIAGLGADEMPAILRRNEEVLTRDDPRHRFNLGGGSAEPPVVNIRNINAFDGATIRDEMSSAAGERVILNVVSRNKRLLGIG